MTEVRLTDAQIKAKIAENERKWAMAQKISEVGEYASSAANQMLRAIDPLGMESRAMMFGALSIVVTIAKKNKMTAPELVPILHVLFQGIDAALAEPEKEEEKEKVSP